MHWFSWTCFVGLVCCIKCLPPFLSYFQACACFIRIFIVGFSCYLPSTKSGIYIALVILNWWSICLWRAFVFVLLVSPAVTVNKNKLEQIRTAAVSPQIGVSSSRQRWRLTRRRKKVIVRQKKLKSGQKTRHQDELTDWPSVATCVANDWG
jgi:hypothetical protein